MLGLNKPYVLNTAIYTKGQLEGETIHGTVRLWGSLQDVYTDLLLDGDNVHLSAKSTIHPFADSLNETVGEILVKGSNINPQAFLPTLPKARLNFDATTIPSFTDGVALEGSIDLENDQAGFADENQIPVKRILGEFIVDDKGTVMIEDIGVGLLKDGSIDVSGSIDTAQDQLKLALGINNTGADDFVRQNIAGRLNGSIDVKGETSSPVVNWNLDSGFARTDGMLFSKPTNSSASARSSSTKSAWFRKTAANSTPKARSNSSKTANCSWTSSAKPSTLRASIRSFRKAASTATST